MSARELRLKGIASFLLNERPIRLLQQLLGLFFLTRKIQAGSQYRLGVTDQPVPFGHRFKECFIGFTSLCFGFEIFSGCEECFRIVSSDHSYIRMM